MRWCKFCQLSVGGVFAFSVLMDQVCTALSLPFVAKSSDSPYGGLVLCELIRKIPDDQKIGSSEVDTATEEFRCLTTSSLLKIARVLVDCS